MILTHLVLLNLLGGASADVTPTPPPPAQITSGGAVIVDLPKKRGRKPKKAAEKALEQAEVSPLIDSPRVITEEEAAGMAAMYGIPERQTETEAPAPQEPEAPAEAGILDGFNPFQTHEASTVAEPTQAPEEPQEEDDIALILAIIEAIG